MCLFDIERRERPLLYTRERVYLVFIERRQTPSLATHGQGQGKAMTRARQALLYIERRETPSLHTRESVSLLHGWDADSFSLQSRECVYSIWREDRDVKAEQALLYIERRETLSLHKRESFSLP